MTNINLSQSIQPKKISGDRNKYIDKGTLISLVILILTGLAVGGVKMYLRDYNNKLKVIEAKIFSEGEKINEGDIIRIADFQNRKKAVEDNINSKVKTNDVLDKITGALMVKSHIESFEYDKKNQTVALEVVSDSIEDVAKQILNFKESPYFSNVDALGDYTKNDNKKIIYNAELVLSSKDLEEKK